MTPERHDERPARGAATKRAMFWTSRPEQANALGGYLAKAGFDCFTTEAASVIGVFVEDLSALAQALGDFLSVEEQRRIKALILRDERPALADFVNMETVERFVRHHSTRWLARLLNERRYKSLLQPIVRAEDGRVHGYEFLFRGLKIDGGVVSPQEMFKAVRGTRLGAVLDDHARLCAIETAARLGLRERIFINILPTSVAKHDPRFERTLDRIEESGLSPDQIVFEIVESENVDDMKALARVIEFCRSAGYRIALDDFGSGFNNLVTLIGLKPDYIKLDKGLIDRIEDEPAIWNLVANMIDAAKQSNVLVVAEGVETDKTARLLRTLGADFLQGYLFGHPAEMPLKGDERSRVAAAGR